MEINDLRGTGRHFLRSSEHVRRSQHTKTHTTMTPLRKALLSKSEALWGDALAPADHFVEGSVADTCEARGSIPRQTGCYETE